MIAYTGRRSGRARANAERGAVAILVAVLVPVMVLLTALAVDVGRWYVEAARVQKAADAAALGGVTYMPNNFGDSASTSGTAQATARSVSSVNGFPNSGTSSVVVFNPADYPTQLGVTVSSTVKNLFGAIFGNPTTTIARTAVADYAAPTIMGSPCNALGNQPVSTGAAAQPTGTVINTSSTLCSSNPGYWLRMAGPATTKSNGDRYATKPCSTSSVDPYCVGTTNTEYTPSGYVFTIRVPQAALDANGGPITIYPQVYDPAYIDTSADCTAAPAPTVRVSSWSRASNVVTVNTSSAHGLAVGDSVQLFGLASSGPSGSFTVTSVPNTKRITFANTGSNASGSSGGTVFTLVNPYVPATGINAVSPNRGQDRYSNAFDSSPWSTSNQNPFCSGDNDPGGSSGSTEGFVTSYIVRGQTASYNPLDAPPIANCTTQFKPQTSLTAAMLKSTSGSSYRQSVAQTYHQWMDLCTSTSGTPVGFTASTAGDYYIQVRTNLSAPSSGMSNVNSDGLIIKPTDGGGTSTNPVAYPNSSLLSENTKGHNNFALRLATSTSGANALGDLISISAQNRLPIYANAVGTQNVNLIQVPENAAGSTFDFSFFDISDFGTGTATLQVLGPGDAAWTGCSLGSGIVTASGTDLANCTVKLASGANNGRTGTMTVPIPNAYECTSSGVPAPRECWFRVAFSMTAGSDPNEDTTWSANLNGDPVRLVQ